MKEILKNYISSMIFIAIWYIFYTNNNYFNSFLFFDITYINFKINTLDIFNMLITIYAIVLIPFYLIENEKSKARIIIEYIIKKFKDNEYKINNEEKNSILAWLVKLFFAPLMIMWISSNLSDIINKVYYWYSEIWMFFKSFYYFYNNYIFITIFKLIIFIDLLFFTLWYLVESKHLWNKIKSVEPTMLWWVVALICYPPFNWAFDSFVWWYSSDFPTFWNIYIHIILNTIVLISFWIYSRASVSLWLKASNLTNRWIITKWPYKYVRHPAYIAKNISWFIWAFPLIFINIKNLDLFNLLIVLLSISTWWFIYYMRAITEEKHLEMDKDYIEYKKKVKYKFIPKIY